LIIKNGLIPSASKRNEKNKEGPMIPQLDGGDDDDDEEEDVSRLIFSNSKLS